VLRGVPRLYRNAWLERGSWQREAVRIAPWARWEHLPEDRGTEKSRESFSYEWAAHQPGDVTWQWRVDERLAFFSEETDLPLDILPGRWVLDAGCGNGELTCALAEAGANVVGLDLSRSVVRAESLRRSDRVHFVQGEILRLPFQSRQFDVVYSSGVLHHTRQPQHAFHRLVASLRAGSRIYVWLYGTPKEADLAAYTVGRETDYWLKPYLGPLPGWLKPIAVTPRAARTWLRSRRHGRHPVSFAHALVGAMDALTPFYRSHHHFDEVRAWFEAKGLRGITLRGVREPGFGVYGDLPH
jgi:2-polyprenyl-3-methyl-5-hydroxy-6-metoxy-1,4-benzoquinol methylase